MFKINLHAHTRFSDGVSSIAEMARTCKELGHCACVITDHVYSLREDGELDTLSLSPKKFKMTVSDARAIEQLSGFPVIVGIELSLRGYEEVVVIGTAAIIRIFEIRERNSFITIQDMLEIRSKYDCAVNLCHPMNATRFIEARGHEILDGYEYIHCGQFMFTERRKELSVNEEIDPYEKFGLTRLCNSDAHTEDCLARCCNVIEDEVRTESDLIAYFKSKKSVRHMIGEELI